MAELVKICDFPSDTNFQNFRNDMSILFPGIVCDVDFAGTACYIPLDDYEEHQDQITEFANVAGAVVSTDSE